MVPADDLFGEEIVIHLGRALFRLLDIDPRPGLSSLHDGRYRFRAF